MTRRIWVRAGARAKAGHVPGLATLARLAVEAEHHRWALDDMVVPQRPHRGADGEELGRVRAPGVAVLAQLDADDALGVVGLGLGLHPAHQDHRRSYIT